MAYVQTEWVAGVTPLSEANMDHLETQYDEAKADLDAHEVLGTGVHGAGGDVLATDADIATHAALATGIHGVAGGTVGVIKSGNYAGNNTDDRQITTGFLPKIVFVTDLTNNRIWISLSATEALMLEAGAAIAATADVVLDAADGFVVDQVQANTTGRTYYYVAIG